MMTLIVERHEYKRSKKDGGGIDVNWNVRFPTTKEDCQRASFRIPDSERDGVRSETIKVIDTRVIGIEDETFDCLESLLQLSIVHAQKGDFDTIGKAFLQVVREAYEVAFWDGYRMREKYAARGLEYPEEGGDADLYPIEPKE